MTPLQIKMVLHYYAINAPYSQDDPLHANSPAVWDQRDLLLSEGVIKSSDSAPGYTITDRGVAYVEALCAMPLPVSKWVMP